MNKIYEKAYSFFGNYSREFMFMVLCFQVGLGLGIYAENCKLKNKLSMYENQINACETILRSEK